ncbi:hypothetical protein GWI33_001716 [Rhynchophorus ferrugineus]|uniref:Secreted protein n=1 Tax=Rhynchophorus ferrugineus TaxID=354439 RepID=A0A834IUL1_RHYFE|nr:hypothetical protein GWI33_001716 [Rhynchophorus ferrugineus]
MFCRPLFTGRLFMKRLFFWFEVDSGAIVGASVTDESHLHGAHEPPGTVRLLTSGWAHGQWYRPHMVMGNAQSSKLSVQVSTSIFETLSGI